MQEAERAKQQVENRIQTEINRARDQNAKRKMDKVQSREWDSGKGSGEREARRPPQRGTDNYRRQSASNQPASKHSTKPGSGKSASCKSTPNDPFANEPTLDELSSKKSIPDSGPPEIPEIPVSGNVFSPDQENDCNVWLTQGDTTIPKDAFSPAQEKLDYSEWFVGNTSKTTQDYSNWSTPDHSASQTETQTGSHQFLNYRGGDRSDERGRGRGRGGSGGEGGRLSGTEKEALKPS